jgi:chemotaxis protein histidine kinase CheA/ActR/RegA family two-component response regulator
MDNDRILGYFLEEASEHLITIEQGLRKLPETVRQPTMIRELFRAAHSIKGSAAMLGLTDVQKISNQFEANFRLLKEHPQIEVDSQLQSLFLQSFGFLYAGIEEVRAASNPYQLDPELGDPIGDPVFEELKAYLQQLVTTSETPAVVVTGTERNLPRDPAIEQVFGEYVSRKLDEVISLCLQPDRPEIRAQIQQICQKLGNLGENFEFLEWTNLFTACRLAIANPDNPLAQLGESISIAVKQAQVLVLADRHQAIGITPDLEAFIGQHRSDRDVPASITTSTWQLDDAGGTSKSTGMADDTTQKLPDLISINTGKVAALTSGIAALEIGTGNRFTEAMSMPAAEFDPEAMELNEFMNLLSNDLPTEGTWMQDDDFLDRDIPLMDLSGDDTDKFYSQISEPFTPTSGSDAISELLQETGSLELAPDLATYDEETFYDPNLGNTDDRDLPSFLLDSELAATHQNSYTDLDLPGNIDRQLQPDLSSALDLGDIPAPDFSLDHPMSDLFITAPTPENWSELDDFAPISGEIGLSLDAISDFDRAVSIDDLAMAIDNATPELQVQPDPLLAITDEIAPPVSDVLYFEDLNVDELSEASDLLVLEDLTDRDLPESLVEKDRINDELNNWIDNSIAEQELEDLEFDLDLLDGDSAVSISNDNPIGFELDSLNVPDLEFAESSVADLEPQPDSSVSNVPADSLDLELLVDAAISEELSDLNFSEELSVNLNTDDGLGLGIASSLAEPLEAINESESELDEDIFDAFEDLYTSEELSVNSTVNDDALGLGIAGLANEAELDADIFDAFNDLDLNEPAPDLAVNDDALGLGIAGTASEAAEIDADIFDAFNDLDLNEPAPDLAVNDDGLGLGIAGLASEAELDADIFDAFNDLDLNEPAPDLVVNDDALGLGIAGIASEDAEIDADIFDAFNDLDLNEPSIDLIANGSAIGVDIAESLGDRVEIDETIFDDADNLDFDRVSPAGLTDLELNAFNSDRPTIDLTSNENLIDLIDSSVANEPASNSMADDFAGLDFSENNDLINFDLDLQSFDDLAIDPAIDSSSLNLDFLNSSEASTDDMFDDNALNLAPNLNSAPDRTPSDLDLLASNFDSIDLAESSTTDSLDFAGLDLNILDEPVDASGLPSMTNFDDLNFNLDDLGADLADSESLLAGLEVPESNSSELGNLDALLGLTALGVAGSAIAIAHQSSAFDDLDALVETSSTSGLDDLDSLFAAPAPVVETVVVTPDRESKDRRAPKQSRTFEQTMRVSVRHLNNLNNLVGELVVNRNTLEQDQNRMRQFVEKLLSEVQKLNEVGKRMQDLYERSLMENSLVASRQQHKPTTTTSSPLINSENLAASDTSIEYDPLEMDRFTPIHLLSQKMIELTVRVRESTADIEFVVDGSTEVTRTLRQITGQLQEDLTKSRMVPFAQTADRLQRGVRDNGLKYGKQVELSIEGRDTLIDKVILESLSDPLIHMVNNAIAHGIESPETRQANGKSGDGKITIRALHQGNQTIISVSDDGAGINTEYVKKKAIEKGLITVQQSTAMPKSEAYELLFLPGFSTKDQADELAGRGVGMDVVKTGIAEIRGTIATESQIGTGTTFTIRLPLALSIAKALIAVNNKCSIAFPMDGIEDTQDVSPEQIQTNSDGQQCIFWRDELMPFKPLSELLGFNRPLARNNFYSTNEDDSDLVSILILRSDGNFTAVQVDKITGDQEIVIKPLQGPASKPLGIAGATVMGDGRIVPIADVMELIALANGTLTRHVSTQWTAQMSAPTVEIRESMVLIVDDSITVRELLSLTFKRAGYRVEQARDGQEAWDKLRAGLPCDIVFCDIEMPRMDGLEFLSRIQKDPALSKVPVAMLTSRGSDRHRQIASQLGASGYFIKPYLEEALLDAAKRMIGGEVLEIV